jgi:5-methylcytosine-specific restriction endonuclease McrA
MADEALKQEVQKRVPRNSMVNATGMTNTTAMANSTSTSTSTSTSPGKWNKPKISGPKYSAIKSRYIPVKTKKLVWLRDGGTCQHKLPGGKLCGSTFQLEFDHIQPFAKGGTSEPENLRLTCRSHNAFAAIQSYGLAKMAHHK